MHYEDKNMSRFLPFLIALLVGYFVQAQNLVPNPSFEELGHLPVSENPRNSYEYEPLSGYKPFQKNLKYWYAGTQTTPDLRIYNEKRFRVCDRRFDDCDQPRTGQNMVGIITSMRNTYTDSYREYVQIKLIKTLRPGIKTHAEVWVAKERQAKLVSNNIGFYFSQKSVFEETEEVLSRKPQINQTEVINRDGKEWVKIGGTFVPDKPLRYLLIGNFYHNEQTTVERYEHYTASPYVPPYAYYLLDDVRVWQEGDQPEDPNFELASIKKEEPVRLENITFEFDRAVLQSSSYKELEKLHEFLVEHAELKIAIHGHTDNQGDDDYNLALSLARARAVEDFLITKGIAADRLQSEGFGETQPLESNETESGRATNRRVEFIVLE